MDLLKIDLFDRKYVTPAGDLIQLPAGSIRLISLLKFIRSRYALFRCKVNHQLVTLNVELKSGDIVKLWDVAWYKLEKVCCDQ